MTRALAHDLAGQLELALWDLFADPGACQAEGVEESRERFPGDRKSGDCGYRPPFR